jgi:DNA-binding MarR family transcriptional regulator
VTDDFPLELKQFIAQNVESLAQLVTLLHLHRDPEREWNAAELARELYISTDMCEGIIADLERRRLAVCTDSGNRYRFHVDAAAVQQLVDLLAEYYRERRVAVITELYSKPSRKVQTFADAFRLRREE